MNSLNLYIGQLQGRLCTNVVRVSDDELLSGVVSPETGQDQTSPQLLSLTAVHLGPAGGRHEVRAGRHCESPHGGGRQEEAPGCHHHPEDRARGKTDQEIKQYFLQ